MCKLFCRSLFRSCTFRVFRCHHPMSLPALVGWEIALSRFLAKTGNPFSEHAQFSRFRRGFSHAYVRAPASVTFRFLPSPFVCYRLIFIVLWVKMVFFFVGSRLHGRKGALRRGAKWAVGAFSSPPHELRGAVARGEGKGEGKFQKSSPLIG